MITIAAITLGMYDQLAENARQRLQPERVGRDQDDGEHHEPEHQVREHPRRVEVRA
jgi:hypothetical protein